MDSFDDNKLRYELESRGQSVGPIVDSTRELYRKVLKRLLDEEMAELYKDQQTLEQLLASNASASTSGPKSVETESKSKPKSKFLLFLFSLILCIIFAYIVKRI